MKGRHVIGLSIVLIISCSGLRSSYTTLFAMHNLVFCIDDQITYAEKHAIMNFIQVLHERDIAYASDNILLIRQEFPFINSIAVALLPTHMMQYTIHIAEPCCIVNQDLAFTKNNILVTKQIFTPTSIQSVPAIFVDEVALQTEQSLHSFQQCITELPRSLFTDYNVAWFNPMHVRLYDKNQPQFSIVFSTDHLPDMRIISACTSIKHNLIEQALLHNSPVTASLANPSLKKNKFEKKRRSKTSNWAADIRFNNQIVLYAEKGDRGHG